MVTVQEALKIVQKEMWPPEFCHVNKILDYGDYWTFVFHDNKNDRPLADGGSPAVDKKDGRSWFNSVKFIDKTTPVELPLSVLDEPEK